MFAPLLDQIPGLAGALVTADALHAQREHASYLHRRGAHYLLTVKGDQPSLHRQLQDLPWADVPAGHTESGRGHGRIEKRTLKVVTVTAGLAFPRAAQAIEIIRRTRRPARRKWRTEICYAITALAAEHARPDQLAAWLRGRWKIENQFHWVRDVTFGEDLSQARNGTGPHVMAACATSPSASCASPAMPTSPEHCGTPHRSRPGASADPGHRVSDFAMALGITCPRKPRRPSPRRSSTSTASN